MSRFTYVLLLVLISVPGFSQVADFTLPDTVCVNTPIQITNTSSGGNSWYWNFCSGSIYNTPRVTNLGNIGGVLNIPTFNTIIKEGDNFFVFVCNNTGSLIRYAYGNSLLNTPVVTNMGGFGGVIPYSTEGIAIENDGGEWYVMITGGSNANSRLVKIKFGSSLANNPTTATNLGNPSGINFPCELNLIKEGGNWYGFTVGALSNSITRYDFGNSLDNVPAATNLGNLGNLSIPAGLTLVQQNGNWHMFIANDHTSTISRVDFGTSLTNNTPTGVNLGTSPFFRQPRDIAVYKDCGELFALVVNDTQDYITRVDFGGNLTNPITTSQVMLPGANFSFPHSIAQIRVADTLYLMMGNANNHTLTRVEYTSCTQASITSSLLFTPPAFTYSTPGTYTVSLVMDEGLPTQRNVCKSVVVLPPPAVSLGNDITITNGQSTILDAGSGANYRYNWNTGDVTQTIAVTASGTYKVEVFNGGCTAGDEITVTNIQLPPTTADFSLPDTVCVNAPVQITNTSTGGSTWYWNFCSGSLYNSPVINNLGNISNALNVPTFNVLVKQGDNYYGFIANNTGSLVRYTYGNSLLNTPMVTNMGNFGGVIPGSTEGVAVENDGTGWYVFVAGGYGVNSRVVKIAFGNSLGNNPTAATSIGVPAGLDFPHEFNLVKDGNNWYGFTIGANSNTIGRYDFGTSLNNTPVMTHLGNIGSLNFPTGLTLIQQNGNWRLFIANAGSNSITRIDLGPGLANNAPVGVNLGANPMLNGPRDIAVFRDCGQTFGLAVNSTTDYITRIDFDENLNTTLAYSRMDLPGGNLSLPHSIAQIRVADTLYLMIGNAYNNSLTRVAYQSCTQSSITSSQLQTPPSYTYTRAGTYNVSLVLDEGLPTQRNICKTIVVVAPPVIALGNDTTICNGLQLALDAGAGDHYRYHWNTGHTGRTLDVSTSGTYTVDIFNGGCTTSQDIDVSINPAITFTTTVQPIDCKNTTGTIDVVASGGTGAFQYSIKGIGQGTNNRFTGLTTDTYEVMVEDSKGCTTQQQVAVTEDQASILTAQSMVLAPGCAGETTGAVTVQVNRGVPPFEYAINNGPYQASPNFSNLGQGAYTISVRNNACDITLQTQLTDPAVLSVTKTVTDDVCGKAEGAVVLTPAGGTPPYLLNWNNTPATSPLNGLSEGNYVARITDAHQCELTDNITVANIIIPPVTILNNDTTINIGDRLTLHAVNAVDYLWSPADGLSCTDCASPVAMPLKTTTYKVTTVSGQNCIATDEVTVNVIFNINIHFPNAFSPNSDGVNDTFKPKTRGIEKYHLQIYNRWGQLLFESADPFTGWDGRFRQLPQDVGTYVYMAEYQFYGSGETLQRRGTFVLVR